MTVPHVHGVTSTAGGASWAVYGDRGLRDSHPSTRHRRSEPAPTRCQTPIHRRLRSTSSRDSGSTSSRDLGCTSSQECGISFRWQTPIYTRNLVDEDCVHPEVLDRVATATLEAFSAFEAEYSGPGAAANDQFFELQRLRSYQRGGILATMREIATLEGLLYDESMHVLHACKVNRDILQLFELGALGVDLWASIHRDGTAHQRHVHENSLLSGVCYIQVPEQAGALKLHDPRHRSDPVLVRSSSVRHDRIEPPLTKARADEFIFQPRVGDVIIFAPWVEHEVKPTNDDEARVSISFNLHGKWGQLLPAIWTPDGTLRKDEDDEVIIVDRRGK